MLFHCVLKNFIYLFTSTINLFTLLQPFSFPYHFISPLFFQFFSLPYLFISPLPSTLVSLSLFPFIFFYFCLFLFTLFYYKFVTISFILYIVFPYKIKRVPSLPPPPLSLSLSKFFGGFFYFSCISTLG